MRVQRTIAVAAFGLATLFGAAACGSGAGTASSDSGGSALGKPQAVAPNGAEPGRESSDLSAAGKGAAGAAPADQPAQAGGQAVSADQRQVARTAQISVEVDDVYQAARKARDIGTRFHGFVSDEKTDGTFASIELKVAADQLDGALTALSELGPKVLSRGQQAQDVTDQVVDVRARLESQRASVERVRALLGKATAIGEIVQIESELTRRQADLESLEQRAAALGAEVELATVTVQLSRPGATTAAGADDSGFLDGLSAGWRVFLASAQVLLTVLGALLPFLIALAIPAAVIVLVLRRRRPTATSPAPAVPPSA